MVDELTRLNSEADQAILDNRLATINEELAMLLKDKNAVQATTDMLSGLTGMVQSSASLGNVFKDAQNEMDLFFSDMGGSITEGFAPALAGLRNIFDGFLEGIGTSLGTFFTNVGNAIEPLMGQLEQEAFPGALPSGATPSYLDLMIQGGLNAMLGIPLGFVNMFMYFLSPGGGLFG